jgi:hypothetical protein
MTGKEENITNGKRKKKRATEKEFGTTCRICIVNINIT